MKQILSALLIAALGALLPACKSASLPEVIDALANDNAKVKVEVKTPLRSIKFQREMQFPPPGVSTNR